MTWLEADPSAEARYRAIDALPMLAGSVPSLLAALGDQSWRVRRLASDRLAALPPDAAVVKALVAMLANRDDTGARNAAAAVLTQIGRPALHAVVALLDDDDPDRRKFAADILGGMEREEAVRPLVVSLGDGDPNVRTAVAEALGQLGGSEARAALESLLSSNDVLLRVCALEGLSRLRAPVPLPVLSPLLEDPLTRRSAWRLLGHVSHPTVAARILRGLTSSQTRDAALLALSADVQSFNANFDDALRIVMSKRADTHAWLSSALSSGEDDRRRGALRLSRALQDPRLALVIAGSLHDAQDAEVVLEVLIHLGVAGAQVLLSSSEALIDLPAQARAVAADAIVRLAEPTLCEALIRLIDTGEPELAELGARALGRSRCPDAIAPLIRLFDDDTLAVHASRSLVTLASSWPQLVHDALNPMLQGALRPHAVRAWAEIAKEQSSEVLRRALQDPDERVRAAAVEGSLHAPKTTLAALQSALMDESPVVRRAAAKSIGALSPAEGHPLLERALADIDALVLANASRSAGELSYREGAPRLEALAQHADPVVVVTAVDSLAFFGLLTDATLLRLASHPDAEVIKRAFSLGADRPLLLNRAVSALEHERWDVRVAAARMLAVAGGPDVLGALQDAVARETDDVARSLLEASTHTLLERV